MDRTNRSINSQLIFIPDKSSDAVRPQIQRIPSIDVIRVAAIFAVICIHTAPFENISTPVWEVINQCCSFAVPYFFIVAGYLFTSKYLAGPYTLSELYIRYVKRLGAVFITWSIIYFFFPRINLIRGYGLREGYLSSLSLYFHNIINDPLGFLLQGTNALLWFLPALIIALSILCVFIKLRIMNGIFFLAIPMYIFVLLTGFYSTSPIGIGIEFTQANGRGPFVGLLYVSIGMLLANRKYVPSLRLAIIVIIAGLAIQLGEFSLGTHYFNSFTTRKALMGTFIYATGFMFLALSRPNLCASTRLAVLGTFTLGIYVSQNLFIMNMQIFHLEGLINFIWQFVFPMLVFAITFTVTALLSRNIYLRRFVV